MNLKSEACASNLSGPDASSTLVRFCQQQGLPYRNYEVPVALDTFTRYGLDFQRAHVPNTEETLVSSLRQRGEAFELRLR